MVGRVERAEIVGGAMVIGARRKVPEVNADEDLAGLLPRERHYLAREEFAVHHGAHPDELAQVEQFARKHGFEIVETSAARHSVVLQGRCGDFGKAFHVKMLQYEHAWG